MVMRDSSYIYSRITIPVNLNFLRGEEPSFPITFSRPSFEIHFEALLDGEYRSDLHRWPRVDSFRGTRIPRMHLEHQAGRRERGQRRLRTRSPRRSQCRSVQKVSHSVDGEKKARRLGCPQKCMLKCSISGRPFLLPFQHLLCTSESVQLASFFAGLRRHGATRTFPGTRITPQRRRTITQLCFPRPCPALTKTSTWNA